jgi:hypothetical protein
MDGSVIFSIVGVGFTLGSGLVAVTVHATKTRDIADSAAHKARNIEQAQTAAAAKADATFARKDVIAAELLGIRDSLDEIKGTLKTMNAMRGGGMGA